MPHIVLEYSHDLEQSVDMGTLMQTVYEAAVASDVMKPDDIKIRAVPYLHYRLAQNQGSFIHATCRLLAGRTADQKVRLSTLLRQCLADLMPSVYSISVEIVDMDPVAYKKRLLQV